jgi:osmotically-inducible protein OsmY
MNNKFNPFNLSIILAIIISSAMFSGCQEDTATLVKDSSTSIPTERIGLDGEFDSSGLAKRVARALTQDSVLQSVSTVYVAQNDSKIILKGMVSDATMLDRLVTVARGVSGVSSVDTSQVKIR